MSYNFKNLADVELLEGVPEYANAFVEVDGMIKRVPGKGLSSEGDIKTAIIKDSGYDNMLAAVQSATSDAPLFEFECINMTFEEAYQIMASGEPLACFGMLSHEGAVNAYGIAVFTGTAGFGVPCIILVFSAGSITIANLFWTADGISTEAPGGDRS